MQNYLDGNMSLLERLNPDLSRMIADCDNDDSISIVDAKDGNRVPFVDLDGRTVFVHSRFAPEKEAERITSEIKVKQHDLFIVFGFGFAYHLEKLLEQIDRDSNILVFEKSLSIIKEAMTNRDLGNLFRDRRIKILFSSSEEDIAEALRGNSSYRVAFITHRGSFQLDPEYYRNLRRIAVSYLSGKEVNIATLAKFEKSWAGNIARNIRKIAGLPGADIFYDRFQGIPAIVVAAGPSLLKSIDFIRKSAGSSIIIAVDTAYMILNNFGIEPHFCISVDPQVVNARYFEGDREGRTIMVADPTAHPSVFRLFKGKSVLTGMVFRMMKWIEQITGEKGELAYGGSVSTNAYDFARRTGASPVVLVGQDLAFTGGYAHARGSYLDEQIHLRTDRTSNVEMFNRFQLTALPGIFVRGIRGNMVRTNQKMMIFLSWFEKRNDPSLINATSDRAFMSNVKQCDAEDIEMSRKELDLFAAISGIYNSSMKAPDAVKSIREELHARVAEMKREMETLIPIVKRSVKFSDDLFSLISSGKKGGKLDYLLKKLSETDRIIESKNTLTDMISFTMQRVIHTITEGYEIDEDEGSLDEAEKIAKRSQFLYRGLLEGSIFNKKILNNMIKLL